MNRSPILTLLQAHREEYDQDCGDHFGCSCGATPTSFNLTEADDFDSGSKFLTARTLYREHLAAEIQRHLVNVHHPITH